MALSNHLNIKANHVFFYYRNLAGAQKFYEETLGLKRVLDYGFASIHQISPTTFLGLVDETRGMHKTTEPKSVTLSFITEDIDAWYQYLTGKSVKMHRPLKDATRQPTRGFVAYDPEGYFLEFETFLQHEQNNDLQRKLSKTKTTYLLEIRKTTRPSNLGIQGNIFWLYYKDLAAARRFYEEILGFDLLVNQSFAKVYSSSKTGFIGLVDESQGLHRFSEEKSVTVSFFTDDVRSWLTYLKTKDETLRSQSIQVESDAVEYFIANDVGGYFLEFDQFLVHELNQEMLRALEIE